MIHPVLRRALVFALPCVLFAQTAIIHVTVVAGEGAVHAAGSRATRPLTVEVTGETGRPLPGAAVSFHFPEEGPSGLFYNGLRTDLVLTDANGRATVRGFLLNQTPGQFQIRITVSKDQARAGIVSNQYIAESKTGPGASVVIARKSNKKRWILISLAAAGAVAGGVLGTGLGSTSPPAAIAPPAAVTAVSVGAPAITVGKP